MLLPTFHFEIKSKRFDDVLYFKDIMHRKHKRMLFPELT